MCLSSAFGLKHFNWLKKSFTAVLHEGRSFQLDPSNSTRDNPKVGMDNVLQQKLSVQHLLCYFLTCILGQMSSSFPPPFSSFLSSSVTLQRLLGTQRFGKCSNGLGGFVAFVFPSRTRVIFCRRLLGCFISSQLPNFTSKLDTLAW